MDGSPAAQMSNRGHQCSVGIEFNMRVCNAIMKRYEHSSITPCVQLTPGWGKVTARAELMLDFILD